MKIIFIGGVYNGCCGALDWLSVLKEALVNSI